MTELEKLIEQRKEITQRIKALQSNETVFNMVRMTEEEKRGGYFKVSVIVNSLSCDNHCNSERWMPVICERKKEEVAHKIRVIISDMSELLASMEGNKNEDKERE